MSQKNKSRQLFFGARTFPLLCIVICANVFAAVHYVSSDGIATWAQSVNIGQPSSWITAMSNAQAGDTTYFRGGTYTISNSFYYWSNSAMNPTHSGAPGNPIVFKAYPKEIPIIVGRNGFGAGYTGQPHHITWDGFHSRRDTIGISNVMIMGVKNITIRNCTIEGYADNADHDNQAGVFLETTDSVLIENCEIFNVKDAPGIHAWGILSYHDSNTVVRNNYIHDCSGGGGILSKDNGQNNRYYKNFIYNIPSWGVDIGSYQAGPDPSNNWIFQNVLFSTTGISIPAANWKARNCKIYNNTLAGGRIYLSAISDTTTDVYNNILTSGILDYSRIPASYSDYNCINGFSTPDLIAWRDSTKFDSNSIVSNPLFVNANGTRPEDFKLQPGSPCIGTGKNGVNRGAFLSDTDIIGIVNGPVATAVHDPGIPAATPDNRIATVRMRGAGLSITLPASVKSPMLTIVNFAGRTVYRSTLNAASKKPDAGGDMAYDCAWHKTPAAGIYFAVIKETAGGAALSRTRLIIDK